MDITPTTTRATAALRPERVAPAAATATVAPAAPHGLAWFDLNGDGKIDNLSTFAGGDSYLRGRAIDVSQRFAVSAPATPTPPTTTPARTEAGADRLFERAAKAYAANAPAAGSLDDR